MKYTFACPIAGCHYTASADANNPDEATGKLTDQVKDHLGSVHPDVHKTDAEIKDDIAANIHES